MIQGISIRTSGETLIGMWRVYFLALLLCLPAVKAETLGFVEQKFSYLNFEHSKWDRAQQLSCSVYSAKQDGAVVEVLRIGAGNLVPFKAMKGMIVRVCGDTASFDEGFDAGPPMTGRNPHR